MGPAVRGKRYVLDRSEFAVGKVFRRKAEKRTVQPGSILMREILDIDLQHGTGRGLLNGLTQIDDPGIGFSGSSGSSSCSGFLGSFGSCLSSHSHLLIRESLIGVNQPIFV
jgi:hypothetical protein